MPEFLTAVILFGTALTAVCISRQRVGVSPWVSAVVAVAAAAWALLLVHPQFALLGFALLASVWGAATAIDLKDHQLPDALTLGSYPAFLLLQLPWVMGTALGTLGRAAIAGIVTAAVLFVVAFINPAGFGLGDVKLGLSTGAALGWFGWGPMWIGLSTSFILMAVISVALLAVKRLDRRTDVAFGPFMVAGVLMGPWLASFMG